MARKLLMRELQRLSAEAYEQAAKFPVILVLDNIRSSYNVGSIFRTSDAFRIEKLYLCGITPTPPSKELYKTAIGAENTVNWEHNNSTSQVLNKLKKQGYTLIGLEQTNESKPLNTFEFKNGTKFVIVLGNEVEGISDESLAMCDNCIEIPQFGTKHSFNVSVSCGIVLWDLYEQCFLPPT